MSVPLVRLSTLQARVQLTVLQKQELAPSNIQVNAIAFGAIETPMNAWLSKEEAEALADEIPAGREGTKEEAAQMICMVADAPDYLTGQILTMDGGWI